MIEHCYIALLIFFYEYMICINKQKEHFQAKFYSCMEIICISDRAATIFRFVLILLQDMVYEVVVSILPCAYYFAIFIVLV